MADLLSSIKVFFKSDEFNIDSLVFKLHYRVTVALLIGSSLIGVAKQYFGDPINCQTSSGVSSKVLDDYCWIHSTFHVRNEFQGNVGCVLDTELLPLHHTSTLHFLDDTRTSPGILQPSTIISRSTPDTSFYQWVPFTLLFQAVIFYLPRKLWKICEGGLMASFGQDAKRKIILKGDFESSEFGGSGAGCKEEIARKYSTYFQTILHQNNAYFTQFIMCEILNLCVDVANIYLTDVFLGGRFMRYGTRVINYLGYDQISRMDMPNPMCTVFPTVTSCTFHSVGTAAGEQKFNSLCVLSLNIINEKVYLLLWFWLFALTFVSGMNLIYRLAIITVPPFRYMLLLGRTRAFSRDDLRVVRKVLKHCYIGDWFILYQLTKNSNCHFFRYLLRHLEKTLSYHQGRSRSSRATTDECKRSMNGEEGTRRRGEREESHGEKQPLTQNV